MIEVSFNAAGVQTTAREAIAILQRISPTLATEAKKDMAQAAAPALAAIRSRIPNTAPMSGWAHRSRSGWSARNPQTAVRVEYTRPRKLDRDQFALITMVQPTAAGTIYDLAANTRTAPFRDRSGRLRSQGQQEKFISNLNRHGTPSPRSRAMWPGTLAALPDVESALTDTVKRVEEILNRELS